MLTVLCLICLFYRAYSSCTCRLDSDISLTPFGLSVGETRISCRACLGASKIYISEHFLCSEGCRYPGDCGIAAYLISDVLNTKAELIIGSESYRQFCTSGELKSGKPELKIGAQLGCVCEYECMDSNIATNLDHPQFCIFRKNHRRT